MDGDEEKSTTSTTTACTQCEMRGSQLTQYAHTETGQFLDQPPAASTAAVSSVAALAFEVSHSESGKRL